MAREILKAVAECEKLMRDINRTGGLEKHKEPPQPPKGSTIERFAFWGSSSRRGIKPRVRLTQTMAKLANHWAINQIDLSTFPNRRRILSIYPHSPFYALGEHPKAGLRRIKKAEAEQRFLEIDVTGAQNALQKKDTIQNVKPAGTMDSKY